MSKYKTGLSLSLVLFLTGCVSGTSQTRPPVEERNPEPQVVTPAEPAAVAVQVKPQVVRESRTEKPVAVPVPTATTSRTKNPAVIALLDNAGRQKDKGAMQAAESSLERAQRIAPRDPEIYYQLADIRRLEGLWPQAEQLALKGTNMAIGDAVMLRRLWLLIADIRAQSGNQTKAREARQRAMRY